METATLETVGKVAGAVAGGGALGGGILAWALKWIWRRQESDVTEAKAKAEAASIAAAEAKAEASLARQEIASVRDGVSEVDRKLSAVHERLDVDGKERAEQMGEIRGVLSVLLRRRPDPGGVAPPPGTE